MLLEGPVAGEINRHAVASEVDLIVMTTHGRGPIARFWLGSVADSLMRQIVYPCIICATSGKGSQADAGVYFQAVLIPLDGSQLAEQILEPDEFKPQ